MKKIAIALLLLGFGVSAHAAEGSSGRTTFSEVVRRIERGTGIRRTPIPFLGLARFFIRVVEPEGVSDLKVAVFEGRHRALPADFHDAIRSAVGPHWTPIVSVVSKRQGEQSLIYARPTRRGMRMLIIAYERNEAAVVELEIDPQRFSRLIAHARVGHPIVSF